MGIQILNRERDGEKTPTRVFSKAQEKHVEKVTGGKRTPNSGATDFGGKADVDVGHLISIECKTKTAPTKSFSIKKEWLDKLKQEMVFDGNKYSALAFNYGPNQECYYVIDENLFLMLCEALQNEQN